ncbi:hypothetical protein OQA88_1862 [Cercophora sp. LCS_1]
MHLLSTLLALASTAVALPACSSSPIPPPPPPPPELHPFLCTPFATFADNSTSASPLVGDCISYLEFPPSDFAYHMDHDLRFSNIFWYKSCMIGARVIGHTPEDTPDWRGTLSGTDLYYLLGNVTQGKAAEDHIEGHGTVTCGGTREVEWAIYEPRNSPFAPGE